MASSSSTPAESFTMLDSADLEAIGAHCHYTYCNQLDFLPFRCSSCKHTYCLDHRTETSHACQNAGAWAAAGRAANNVSAAGAPKKPDPATGTQCSHPTCKSYINTFNSVGVDCATCGRGYCLRHRMQDDHACSTLKPLNPPPSAFGAAQAQRAASAMSRLRAWGKEKAAAAKPTPKPTSAAARMVALNNLKKTAKGDAKVPVDKRIYVHVEAEAATTKSKFPKNDYFYNSDWSVGRMLDEAAKGLQVQNMNNRGGGEEERLRVFHVEGGRMLEFGDKLGKVLVNGNTVVLLRGVGPAIPDLIEA